MSAKELYNSLKKEYENYLVIIKDKQYCKTYGNDAKIMWYVFNYKYVNNMVTFGNNAFDKVVNKLKKLNINFIIISKVEELLSYYNNDSNYLSYYKLSQESYVIIKKENILIDRLKSIYEKNPRYYNKIYSFFKELEQFDTDN